MNGLKKPLAVIFLTALILLFFVVDFAFAQEGVAQSADDCEKQLVWPYPEGTYTVTQGSHGQSYGHNAIDIAAGRGAEVFAPTCGEAKVYVDQYGNTTLEIHNRYVKVTILHDDFEVENGDWVEIGQRVGFEGNNGYTMDFAGNLCNNRPNCGNHSHLDIFVKSEGRSIYPEEIIGKNYPLAEPGTWNKLRNPLPSTVGKVKTGTIIVVVIVVVVLIAVFQPEILYAVVDGTLRVAWWISIQLAKKSAAAAWKRRKAKRASLLIGFLIGSCMMCTILLNLSISGASSESGFFTNNIFPWVSDSLPPVNREEMADIPDSVKAEILRLEPQIRQIAGAQNLHPAVIPVLWGKEGGWARSNPENGECLFGFYSRRLQGNLVCPDPSTDEGLLRQFEMAVEEFRRHAERRGISLTANSSLEDYAEAYMEYNGNIDCYGNPYSSWREHPYVMNGYDSAHRGMVARSGQTDVPCISLQVIGAVPAHIRVAELLGED